MIEADKKLEILKEHNPFISSSTGDPWIQKYPNVESINQNVFSFIHNIISQKQRDLSNSFAGLILGEAGSGKTHIISRMLEQSKQQESPYLFSYIQPIEDPGQTFRYLLREIVISLSRPLDENVKTSQLDIILGRILVELLEKKIRVKKAPSMTQQEFIDKLTENPLSYLESKEMKTVFRHKMVGKTGQSYFLSQYSGIYEEFLTVLFHYRLPYLRNAALSWLKGVTLDEVNSRLLNVKDRSEMTAAALEQEARDILFSIGLLLARYGQMLVICFDRLENLDSDEHVFSFGKMLEFLVDSVQAMLPIAFFRGQLWEERFRNKLNEHVVTRLQTNKAVLEACNTDQALEIIRSRLSYAFGSEISEDVFPFNEDDLKRSFQVELLSPREVIIEANTKLRKILGQTSSRKILSFYDKLLDEFQVQYKILRKDLNQCPPDRNRLRNTLMLYLKNIPAGIGFEITSIFPIRDEDDYVDCACKIRFNGDESIDTAFIIDDSLHHNSVNARLKKGIELLEQNVNSKVYYIRDRRCKFPGPDVWKNTNKTLKRFKENGGIVIKLNQDQVAAWYALTFLLYKVNEGDSIIVENDNKQRAITAEEFSEFIQKHLHNPKTLSFVDMDRNILKSRTADRLKRKRMQKMSVLNLV